MESSELDPELRRLEGLVTSMLDQPFPVRSLACRGEAPEETHHPELEERIAPEDRRIEHRDPPVAGRMVSCSLTPSRLISPTRAPPAAPSAAPRRSR